MRRLIPLTVLLILSGCGGDSGAEQRTAAQATREGAGVTPEPADADDAGVTIDKAAPAVLPATSIDGSWAVAIPACDFGAWRFSAGGTRVETADMACDVHDARPQQNGSTAADASCKAKDGTTSEEQWSWRRTGEGEGERLELTRATATAKPFTSTFQRCPAA